MTAALPPSAEIALTLLRAGLDEALADTRARLHAVAQGKVPPPFKLPETSALPRLASIFHLTGPELDLLTLSAAAELDPATGEAIHAINGTGLCDTALAQRLVGPEIWDALLPEAPLRRWRLLELSGIGPFYQKTLRTDERILHTLLGNSYTDARLEPVIEGLWPEDKPEGCECPLADKIVAAWTAPQDRVPVILLCGRDATAKRNAAAAAAPIAVSTD